MIRYYSVVGDTRRGEPFEYCFNHLKDAEKKYKEITGVPYKALLATDDKQGEILVDSES